MDEELLKEYNSLIRRITCTYCRQYPMYHDDFISIAQYTLLKAYKTIPSQDKQIIVCWLAASIRNNMINFCREMIYRNGKNLYFTNEQLEDDFLIFDYDDSGVLEYQDLIESLIKNKKHKDILKDIFLTTMSAEQIAAKYNRSYSFVYLEKERAMKYFKGKLNDYNLASR